MFDAFLCQTEVNNKESDINSRVKGQELLLMMSAFKTHVSNKNQMAVIHGPEISNKRSVALGY